MAIIPAERVCVAVEDCFRAINHYCRLDKSDVSNAVSSFDVSFLELRFFAVHEFSSFVVLFVGIFVVVRRCLKPRFAR
jgi:hypothetical protein